MSGGRGPFQRHGAWCPHRLGRGRPEAASREGSARRFVGAKKHRSGVPRVAYPFLSGARRGVCQLFPGLNASQGPGLSPAHTRFDREATIGEVAQKKIATGLSSRRSSYLAVAGPRSRTVVDRYRGSRSRRSCHLRWIVVRSETR